MLALLKIVCIFDFVGEVKNRRHLDTPISSDLTVLVLSGAFDPITLAFTGETVLENLPNSFTFEFPYGENLQFLTGNGCAQRIVMAIITDPTTELDSSCIGKSLPAVPPKLLRQSRQRLLCNRLCLLQRISKRLHPQISAAAGRADCHYPDLVG